MKNNISKKLRTAYDNMKKRCYNPKSKGYKYYGGKGVIICEEWLKNRKLFYKWALANGYLDSLSIDRIDSNGNYEPSNCRWITMLEQQSNKTNNVFIEIDGEIKNARQWSLETGISPQAIIERYNNGDEDIFKDIHKIIEIDGKIKTLKELSEESGISYSLLLSRINAGWSIEDLLADLKTNETKNIEINGETRTATEWAEISGLTREIILNRISYGWKSEDLLEPRKRRGKKKYIEINGESHTIPEWCKIVGISKGAFYKRLNKGIIGKELILPPKNK